MNVLLLHAGRKAGNTYQLARQLIAAFDLPEKSIRTLHFPDAFSDICTGCCSCIIKDEKLCPHAKNLNPVTAAIHWADVLVFAAPVYVYHTPGAIKNLLDHYGWQWMVHRPSPDMFKKQAVCLTTAAGAGMKSANRDIADSLRYWGIGRIYTYGQALYSLDWERVAHEKKNKIEKDLRARSKKITRHQNRPIPSLRTKYKFYTMRIYHRRFSIPLDRAYWTAHGWLSGEKPWRQYGEK